MNLTSVPQMNASDQAVIIRSIGASEVDRLRFAALMNAGAADVVRLRLAALVVQLSH